MLNGVLAANAIKEMLKSLPVLFLVGELNAIVREHGMDGVGQRPGKLAQELRGVFLSCAAVGRRSFCHTGQCDRNTGKPRGARDSGKLGAQGVLRVSRRECAVLHNICH